MRTEVGIRSTWCRNSYDLCSYNIMEVNMEELDLSSIEGQEEGDEGEEGEEGQPGGGAEKEEIECDELEEGIAIQGSFMKEMSELAKTVIYDSECHNIYDTDSSGVLAETE